MFKLFHDGKIWTIPNVMSFFRLLLVPIIIWSYLGLQNTTLTVVLLIVSGLTDVLDGQIARRFHMVSDLGKALDPIADKLTQVSIVLCLALSRPLLWILLGICVVREPCIGFLAYTTMHKTNTVPCAKWYGKLSTFVLDASTLALLLFPQMPQCLANTLIGLSIFFVVLALLLYARYHMGVWKQAETQKLSE